MYSGLINTIARKAGLSPLDAEDCAQQTWLTLYKKRKYIKDPVALPAWLIKTTYRQAVYQARHLKPDQDIEAASEQADTAELPDETVTQLEYQAVLEYALKQLDPRCRRLLTELYLAPQTPSYKDIAKSINILPNSIGPLRSRCLLKLKEILKKMGYETD